MMSGEYIDNNTKDDFSLPLTDDLDAPLLLHDNDETTQTSQSCLYGQKGFRRPSIDPQSTKAKRQLLTAMVICFVFMIAELVGGYAAGSLAIITDAAHLLSDCISFIVAILALWFAKKPADNKMSFGYKRVEVLGAVISVIGIWILTGILLYLASCRLINRDFEIDANTMIVVSIIGVFINIVMGVVLHGSCSSLPHGHSHDLKSNSLGHHHSHNHNNITNNNIINSNNIASNTAALFLAPPEMNGIRNYTLNRHHSFSSLNNNHNSSRSHSRHNSFTKVLNHKISTDDTHRASVDLLRTRIDEPLIHRMSIDGGLTRVSIDNRSLSHSKLCGDIINIQIPPQLHHRCSVDSSQSSSDSGHQRENGKQNINIRAAVIHVIGDFVQSIGVLLAAIIIKIHPNAKLADPICTFLFSIIVIFTTVRIIKESIVVLLDAVPSNVVLSNLKKELKCIQGVRSLHHLNVWSLSVDWNCMSVHLIVDESADTDEILHAATTIARKGFDIKHTTIQIEKFSNLIDVNGLVNFDIGDITL